MRLSIDFLSPVVVGSTSIPIHMSILPSFESTVEELEIKTNFNGCQRKGGQKSQSDFLVSAWNSAINLLHLQLSKNR